MNTVTAEQQAQPSLLTESEKKPGKRTKTAKAAEPATQLAVIDEPAKHKQKTEIIAAAPASLADRFMTMLERAVSDPDFDIDKMDRLLAAKKEYEAEEARRQFIAAMAGFKAKAPTILKNKSVGFESKRTGDTTSYRHATLDYIDQKIAPVLSEFGLSHSWKTEQVAGGVIIVTCFLKHIMGHTEQVTLQGSPDTSGTKNSIQAVGSTVTYLQRYTLLAITGMATADQDIDGGQTVEFITDEQKQELVQMMKDTGSDTMKFLEYMGVEDLDHLPAWKFKDALAALKKKQTQPKTQA
jgi:hypothetical protein